jgi:hypothetical protein
MIHCPKCCFFIYTVLFFIFINFITSEDGQSRQKQIILKALEAQSAISRHFLRKVIVAQLFQMLAVFYGPRRVIAVVIQAKSEVRYDISK